MASSGSGAGGNDDPPRLVGYSRQYTLLTPVRTARLTLFRTADGEAIDLSYFWGKVVLLNFWATWCAPCVREMPSLNRLAAEMACGGLAVVPVAIDRAGLSAVIPFYRDHGLDNLAMYLDPDQRTAYTRTRNPNNAEFALYGLPISHLVDRQGRVRGLHSRRRRLGLRGGKGPAPLLHATDRKLMPGRRPRCRARTLAVSARISTVHAAPLASPSIPMASAATG
jgi:thiol-disulfide isomerase/thioredoxin